MHLTNSELKIPHLMGLQYIGRPNQFTGDLNYMSEQAELREKTGIIKMLEEAGIEADSELLKYILRLNVRHPSCV